MLIDDQGRTTTFAETLAAVDDEKYLRGMYDILAFIQPAMNSKGSREQVREFALDVKDRLEQIGVKFIARDAGETE
jgi:hypothetical protein